MPEETTAPACATQETITPTVGDILFGREEGFGWWRENVIEITYVSEQTTLAIVRFERTSLSCVENPGNTRWCVSDGRESSWALDVRPWSLQSELEVESIAYCAEGSP